MVFFSLPESPPLLPDLSSIVDHIAGRPIPFPRLQEADFAASDSRRLPACVRFDRIHDPVISSSCPNRSSPILISCKKHAKAINAVAKCRQPRIQPDRKEIHFYILHAKPSFRVSF
jgi:hypothetical protein